MGLPSRLRTHAGELWQRLRSDEQAIKHLLFSAGILGWLLATGGMHSTPAALGTVVNSGLVLLALYLVGRAWLRLRRPAPGPSVE